MFLRKLLQSASQLRKKLSVILWMARMFPRCALGDIVFMLPTFEGSSGPIFVAESV